MPTESKFLVAIYYKNGTVIRDWFTEFSIDNGVYTWNLADPKEKILKLGANEIMAVIQEDFEVTAK
jgi:hypothetical protein